MTAETTLATKGLYQVAQHVGDLDRAVAFYRDTLGLRLLGKFDPPGLAMFDAGGPRIMLSREGEQSGVIYLQVDDLERAVDSLRAQGVTIEHEAHMIHKDTTGQILPAGTEEWMAFIRDSEGNVLGLASRVVPS